jgi:hypothetical protein
MAEAGARTPGCGRVGQGLMLRCMADLESDEILLVESRPLFLINAERVRALILVL